jgi:farnesyl-diphosphate farnesyltransferase
LQLLGGIATLLVLYVLANRFSQEYGVLVDYVRIIATLAFMLYPVCLILFMAKLGHKAGQDAAGKDGKSPHKKKPSKAGKLLAILSEPSELVAVARLKLGALPSRSIPAPAGSSDEICADVAFCDDMLVKVSRSFSAVIRQLPDELCLPVCIFYLVLRALDTVEDETDLSKFDCAIGPEAIGGSLDDRRLEAQRKALRSFFALHPKEAEVPLPDIASLAKGGVGKDDEARLLREYGHVIRVFRVLPAGQQVVIQDICKKMGLGMAEYLGRDLGAGTEDLADYNKYCHIVAGLVGEGLTRQFHVSGFERFAKEGTIGNRAMEEGLGSLPSDMGLFLQKTNIIRDYLEDLHDGRSFWPRSLWSLHAPALADFVKPESSEAALACLNKLVFNALELAPRSLAYLECLENPRVFAFCAVPQVMAVMTLSELFDNADVFTGVVKIRKPLAAKILLSTGDLGQVRAWFARACRELRAKVQKAAKNVIPEQMHEVLVALEAAALGLRR